MVRDVRFFSTYSKRRESIFEFGQKLFNAFKLFSQYDERFRFIHIHLPKQNILIDLFNQDNLKDFSNAILEYNKKDIKKYDKLANPTVDFNREFGFSLGFNFSDIDGENILSLYTRFAGDSDYINYQLDETPIKQIEKYNSNWYINFIKSLVKFLPIQYGVVKPRDMEFLTNTKPKYKYPLGFMTYFNNELKSLIPCNIKGLEYQELENGLLVKLANDSIPESDEDFENKVNTLYSIMESIGEVSPDFKI